MSEDSKKIKLISWNIQKSTDGVENPKTKSEVIKSLLETETNTIVVLQETTDKFMIDELIPFLASYDSNRITLNENDETMQVEENLSQLIINKGEKNYEKYENIIKVNLNKWKIGIKLINNKKITIYSGRNVNNKAPNFRTVVITNLEQDSGTGQDSKFSFERDENKETDYKNRYVKTELTYEKKPLSILGLHAKDAEVLDNWLENETETILELELESKEEGKYRVTKNEKIYYKPDIMIGDFNSGNYIREKNDSGIEINRAAYQKVSTGYIDVCQGMYTRQGAEDTQIDHILIKNSKEVWDKIEVKNPSCGYKKILGDDKIEKVEIKKIEENKEIKEIIEKIKEIEGKIKEIEGKNEKKEIEGKIKEIEEKIKEIEEKIKEIEEKNEKKEIEGKIKEIEGKNVEEIKKAIRKIKIETIEILLNKLSDHLPISCDIIFKQVEEQPINSDNTAE